jgi:hypothetical protein
MSLVDKILLESVRLVNNLAVGLLRDREQYKPIMKQFQPIKVLGQGHYGVAYLLKDNKVLKITRDTSEAQACYGQMKNPSAGMCKIFSVHKIPPPQNTGYSQSEVQNQSNIYIIVKELVQPLTQKEADALTIVALCEETYNNLDGVIRHIRFNKSEFGSTLLKKAKQFLNDRDFFNDIWHKYDELVNSLPDLNDIHGGNVGWGSDGKLIAFDAQGYNKEDFADVPGRQLNIFESVVYLEDVFGKVQPNMYAFIQRDVTKFRTKDEKLAIINKMEKYRLKSGEGLPETTVNIDMLVPTQVSVDDEHKPKTSKDPFCVKLHGIYYLLDGHHRVYADKKKGVKKIQVKLLDLD